MSAAGYTTVFNEALRDNTLSLSAKGLYAVIKSFIGLKDFQLSKRCLAYACSDSSYMLNAAWSELKKKGYLQHLFTTAENGAFCHIYNLMQHAGTPVNYVYSPHLERTNGDVICISESQSDYTNISTAILRDKNISLASKGLYSLVSYLKKIPDFTLRPEGIRAFCKEKLKHFSTLWKKFKISGLLKQQRFPSGKANRWTYKYQLCETPDFDTPYLTNYHADGSVSTESTISDFLTKIPKIVRKHKKQKHLHSNPRPIRRKQRKRIEALINADQLRNQYSRELIDTVIMAIYNIFYGDKLTIRGMEIAHESREAAAHIISPTTIQAFLSGLSLDFSRISNPVAYLQTALFSFHQKLLNVSQVNPSARAASIADSTSPQPLSIWEQDWLRNVKAHLHDSAQKTK